MFQTTNQLCIRKNGGVLKWFPHRFKRCPDAWQGCFRDAVMLSAQPGVDARESTRATGEGDVSQERMSFFKGGFNLTYLNMLFPIQMVSFN